MDIDILQRLIEHRVLALSGDTSGENIIFNSDVSVSGVFTASSIDVGSTFAWLSGTNVYANYLGGSQSTAFQPSGVYGISGNYLVSGVDLYASYLNGSQATQFQPSGVYQASGVYAPSGAYAVSGLYIPSGATLYAGYLNGSSATQFTASGLYIPSGATLYAGYLNGSTALQFAKSGLYQLSGNFFTGSVTGVISGIGTSYMGSGFGVNGSFSNSFYGGSIYYGIASGTQNMYAGSMFGGIGSVKSNFYAGSYFGGVGSITTNLYAGSFLGGTGSFIGSVFSDRFKGTLVGSTLGVFSGAGAGYMGTYAGTTGSFAGSVYTKGLTGNVLGNLFGVISGAGLSQAGSYYGETGSITGSLYGGRFIGDGGALTGIVAEAGSSFNTSGANITYAGSFIGFNGSFAGSVFSSKFAGTLVGSFLGVYSGAGVSYMGSSYGAVGSIRSNSYAGSNYGGIGSFKSNFYAGSHYGGVGSFATNLYAGSHLGGTGSFLGSVFSVGFRGNVLGNLLGTFSGVGISYMGSYVGTTGSFTGSLYGGRLIGDGAAITNVSSSAGSSFNTSGPGITYAGSFVGLIGSVAGSFYSDRYVGNGAGLTGISVSVGSSLGSIAAKAFRNQVQTYFNNDYVGWNGALNSAVAPGSPDSTIYYNTFKVTNTVGSSNFYYNPTNKSYFFMGSDSQYQVLDLFNDTVIDTNIWYASGTCTELSGTAFGGYARCFTTNPGNAYFATKANIFSYGNPVIVRCGSSCSTDTPFYGFRGLGGGSVSFAEGKTACYSGNIYFLWGSGNGAFVMKYMSGTYDAPNFYSFSGLTGSKSLWFGCFGNSTADQYMLCNWVKMISGTTLLSGNLWAGRQVYEQINNAVLWVNGNIDNKVRQKYYLSANSGTNWVVTQPGVYTEFATLGSYIATKIEFVGGSGTMGITELTELGIGYNLL